MTKSYLYRFTYNKYVMIKFKYDSNFKNDYCRSFINQYSQTNTKDVQELVEICFSNNIKLGLVNNINLKKMDWYQHNFATSYIEKIIKNLNVDFHCIIKNKVPEKLWVSN